MRARRGLPRRSAATVAVAAPLTLPRPLPAMLLDELGVEVGAVGAVFAVPRSVHAPMQDEWVGALSGVALSFPHALSPIRCLLFALHVPPPGVRLLFVTYNAQHAAYSTTDSRVWRVGSALRVARARLEYSCHIRDSTHGPSRRTAAPWSPREASPWQPRAAAGRAVEDRLRAMIGTATQTVVANRTNHTREDAADASALLLACMMALAVRAVHARTVPMPMCMAAAGEDHCPVTGWQRAFLRVV